jgi:hypothetical protein
MRAGSPKRRLGVALVGGAMLVGCGTKQQLLTPVEDWIPQVLWEVRAGVCAGKNLGFDYVPIGTTPGAGYIAPGGTGQAAQAPPPPIITGAPGGPGAAGGDSHVTLTVQGIWMVQRTLGGAQNGPASYVPLNVQTAKSDSRSITIKLTDTRTPEERCRQVRDPSGKLVWAINPEDRRPPTRLFEADYEESAAGATIQNLKDVTPAVSEGECRTRCDVLCERHRRDPPDTMSHFCSDSGKGRQACLYGDPGVNRHRCNDANFLGQ